MPDARHAVSLPFRKVADDPVLEQRRMSVDRVEWVLQVVASTSHETRLAFHRTLECESATLGGGAVLLQAHPEPEDCAERCERGEAEGHTDLTSQAFGVQDLLPPFSGRGLEDVIELRCRHQHILVELPLKRIVHRPARCAGCDSLLHEHMPALLELSKDIVLLLHHGTEPSRQSREPL